MNLHIRHRSWRLLIVALALGIGGARAEQSAWERIKTFAHVQKQQAVAEGRKMLAETDRRIEALKKEARNSTAEAKAAHEKNMAELQARKKAAQAELARLEKAAAGTWDAAREGASNAYRDLQAAYEKAAASAKN